MKLNAEIVALYYFSSAYIIYNNKRINLKKTRAFNMENCFITGKYGDDIYNLNFKSNSNLIALPFYISGFSCHYSYTMVCRNYIHCLHEVLIFSFIKAKIKNITSFFISMRHGLFLNLRVKFSTYYFFIEEYIRVYIMHVLL